MSQLLINRSPDLKRLRDEGYEVAIVSGHLVVKGIPYVTSKKEVKRADLISELTLSGEKAVKPGSHTAYFSGEYPCDKNGALLSKIVNSSSEKKLAGNLIGRHYLSSKPREGYADYYVKITTYIAIISSPAQALDPEANPKTFAPVPDNDRESVFNYIDTSSSRAEIVALTNKFENQKIAIVGLGGTGSYILDFVAKTPVAEIHLYDSDDFFQHNAFRTAGAASLADLEKKPKKVDYLKSKYSNMHKHIFAHDYCINQCNVSELENMDFVFIAIDTGAEKEDLFSKLEKYGIAFVDAGMGLYLTDNSASIGGILRVTTSTVYQRHHAHNKAIFVDNNNANNEYTSNIQIADLNALNATLAVIRWKKLFGFYLDLENEHSSAYTIDGNIINNDDKPDE